MGAGGRDADAVDEAVLRIELGLRLAVGAPEE